MPARARVPLLLATAAVSAVLAAQAILAALDAYQVEYSRVFLQQGIYLDRNLTEGSLAGEGVVLTDSLGMAKNPSVNLATFVDAAVKRRLGPDARPPIRGLSFTGMGLYTFYLFSERLVEARPELVVLGLNLFWFADFWQRDFQAQVAGWLPASRWPEALTLPLETGGLTVDRLLLYRAIVASGLADGWDSLQRDQVRVRSGWRQIEEAIQRAIGHPRGLAYRPTITLREVARVTKGDRSTREGAEQLYAKAISGLSSDDPTLEILDAFLARIVRAGIRIVVYVPPHNLEHVRKVGIEPEPGLTRSLARIEDTVARHGGTFFDFHDVFPDSAFRDHLDHLVSDGEDPPLERLGDLLGERLIRAGAVRRDVRTRGR